MTLYMASRVTRQLRPLSISGRQFAVQNSFQVRHGSSDYGSPTGGPISTNPKEAGPNPSADKEHPGPPPPKAGEGTGKSGTKKGADGHETGGAADKQADVRPSVGNAPSQKRQFSTFRTLKKDGPQPKILNEKPPPKSEQSEDVRKHNEEFAKRPGTVTERARQDEMAEKEGEKVEKGYWKGDAGHKDGGKKQDGESGKE